MKMKRTIITSLFICLMVMGYSIFMAGSVLAAPGDANLNSLTINFGTLTPSFSPTIYSYTASVANNVSFVTVTPTAFSDNATITVNGTQVTSGQPSGNISLSVGSNTISVEVTAQETPKQTYTITVTRLSNDATLSNLTISSGTLAPSFVSGTLSYTASVANSVTSVTVTPTVHEAHATVTVNSNSVTSGLPSGNINLNIGITTITVEVTAQDTTKQSYIINVTRVSNDATLSNLIISSGTLTPSFASGTLTYTASVANSVASVTVTPTVTEAHASVTVNSTPVTSGSPSGNINLNVGNTTITVEVTAQDTTTKQVYTITVTRAQSSDASLSNLTISSGTLTPAFSSNNYSYSANVSNAVTSVTVTPTVHDSTATVRVNSISVASGQPSGNINLNVGSNTITVMVTAQDGTTQQPYSITVNKAAPSSSSDASLSNLTISSGTLVPSFSSTTYNYTDSVANGVTSVTVTPTVHETHATVTVNGTPVTSGSQSGNIGLNVGNNTIIVEITAQDTTTKQVYNLTVTRNTAPVSISSVSPSSGPTTGGTTILISGSGFVGTSAITIGGTAATSFTFIDSSQVQAVTPAGTQGSKDVTVTTLNGSATKTGGFTYVTPQSGGDGGIGSSGGSGGVTSGPGTTDLTLYTNNVGLFVMDGAAESEDSNIKLTFEKGVLAKAVDGSRLKSVIIIKNADQIAQPESSQIVGPVYDLTPEGATFTPLITLTFTYGNYELPSGIQEGNLVIATWDGKAGKWIDLKTTVDPVSGTVSALISHFSSFTLITHIKPAAFSVDDLEVSEDEIELGQSVTIKVSVTNSGDLEETYPVNLKVNGETKSSQDIMVGGNSQSLVSFTLVPDMAGVYTLEVNGLSTSLTVKSAPSGINNVPNPAAFHILSLSVKPSEVYFGGKVVISIVAENYGDIEDTYSVTFKINNKVVSIQNVDIPAHSKQNVEYIASADNPGTFNVDVNGETGLFTVRSDAKIPEIKKINWWFVGSIAAVSLVVALFIWINMKRRII
jgi:hypothetical protein